MLCMGQGKVRFWSDDIQVTVKSKKSSELDTGGRETCLIRSYLKSVNVGKLFQLPFKEWI